MTEQNKAWVQAGKLEIAYWRAGRGAPVLLLGARSELFTALRELLAQRFTVIAPELRGRWHGVSSAAWLRSFIDGLGLERPHLVAVGAHGIAALHFALSDPDRIDRLVAVWRERAGGADGVTASDRLHGSSHSLLMVRVPTVAGVELAEIPAFLEAG